MTKTKQTQALVAAIAIAIAGAGCSGSDGTQGPQGPQGPQGNQGPPGQDATLTAATTEACRGCHGAFADKHALTPSQSVLVTVDPTKAVTVSGSDVLVKFNVKVNGVNSDDFLDRASVVGGHVEDAWWVYNVASTSGERAKLNPSDTVWTISWNGSGNYTATLKGLVSATTPTGLSAVTPGATYMINTRAPGGLVATVVAQYPLVYGQTSGRRATVSNQACQNCHGRFVWRGAIHDLTNAPGIDACLVCHNRFGAVEKRLAGSYTNPVAGMEGSGFMGLIHGIHNSANMPDAEYAWTWTNDTSGNKFSFSFPGYMNNCATCHDSTPALAAVKDAPFSYGLCVSCHDGFEGFTFSKAGSPATTKNTHRAFTAVSGCGCHGGETVSDRHNGLKTERSGVIWAGADQSVEWGKRVKTEITSVGYDAGALTTLVVTWKASWDPDGDGVFTEVDPCNNDFALGPVFVGTSASAASGRSDENMAILKAYAVGNDWVNGITGVTSPGQPTSVNLRHARSTLSGAKNTTCAGNVATSKVVADPSVASAARAAVALQGKPQLRLASVTGHDAVFDPMVGTSTEVIQVRAHSPVREYVPGTGALPTTTRREIVSIDKCNACHKGSMYQHGGNRVDSIELCVMCHNPASTEQQNRQGMGVTAAEAYDGKVGQTYDMRTMVHAIHAAGETGNPYVVYRTRGIYFFANQAALDASTWPQSGCISCNGSEGPALYCKVAGSSASGKVPVEGGSCDAASNANSTDGTWLPHSFINVHYPRPLNDCAACHVNDSEKSFPDAKKAVAVTVDMGASVANLLDDVVKGPSAASCMTCHQYGTATTKAALNKHSYDNGWWPAAFTNGRQTLIDAAP